MTGNTTKSDYDLGRAKAEKSFKLLTSRLPLAKQKYDKIEFLIGQFSTLKETAYKRGALFYLEDQRSHFAQIIFNLNQMKQKEGV